MPTKTQIHAALPEIHPARGDASLSPTPTRIGTGEQNGFIVRLETALVLRCPASNFSQQGANRLSGHDSFGKLHRRWENFATCNLTLFGPAPRVRIESRMLHALPFNYRRESIEPITQFRTVARSLLQCSVATPLWRGPILSSRRRFRSVANPVVSEPRSPWSC